VGTFPFRKWTGNRPASDGKPALPFRSKSL
jgi:hypothetical protein